MATSSNRSFWLIQESTQATPETFGVPPTSGTATRIRLSNEDIKGASETIEDAEKGAHRRAAWSGPGAVTVSGTLESSLKYGDDTIMVFEGQMCGTATALTMTSSTLSVTAATRTITDSSSGIDIGKFRPGRKVTLTGFTTAGNNVVNAEILSSTTGTIVFTTATTTLVDEAEGDEVTITSSTKRIIPYDTRRSFYGIREQSDLTTGKYKLFEALQLNDLTVSSTADSTTPVTWSVPVVARKPTFSDTAPSGIILGQASNYEPMTGIDSSVSVDGTEVGIVTGFELTSPNGISMVKVLGSRYGTTSGGVSNTPIEQKKPTAKLTVVVNDDSQDFYDKWDAGTAIRFDVAFHDAAGNEILFAAHNAKITDPSETGDTTLVLELALSLNYDETTGTEFYVDFTPAA